MAGGYCSMVGNSYYIISKDKEECAVFDNFGSLIKLNGCMMDCKSIVPCDLLSVVSGSAVSDKVDVYFNGEHRVSYHPKYRFVSKISDYSTPYMGMIFTIKHDEKVAQNIMIYKEGVLTKEIIDILLDERNLADTWEPL